MKDVREQVTDGTVLIGGSNSEELSEPSGISKRLEYIGER